MAIGYIYVSDRARHWEKMLNIILTTKLEDNYVYEISNIKRGCIKKLNKKIYKDNVKQILCEKKIEEHIEIDKLITGKNIMKYIIYEIIEYIFTKQEKQTGLEDIYFLIKKDEEIYLKNIIFLSKIFKTTNIITDQVNKFQKIAEKLYEEDETVISVSNNKRKSLRRAKYIINFDLNAEELISYNINRTALIINITNDIKIENLSFEGISINNVSLELPDEIKDYFGILSKKIDKTALYASLLNQKQELDRIRIKIKEDNIHILNLIGYNGEIDQNELVRIS